MLHRFLAVPAALALGLISARADTIHAPSPELADYIDSPTRSAEMAQTVRRMIPLVAGSCRDVRAATSTWTRIYKPIRFGSDGLPVAGAFREIVPVSVCGETITLNILATAQPDGSVQRINLLPGTSLADPILQKDVLASAYAAASHGRRCRSFAVRTTAAAEKEPDGSWTETWDVRACGRAVPLTVAFHPSADGGTEFKVSGPARP